MYKHTAPLQGLSNSLYKYVRCSTFACRCPCLTPSVDYMNILCGRCVSDPASTYRCADPPPPAATFPELQRRNRLFSAALPLRLRQRRMVEHAADTVTSVRVLLSVLRPRCQPRLSCGPCVPPSVSVDVLALWTRSVSPRPATTNCKHLPRAGFECERILEVYSATRLIFSQTSVRDASTMQEIRSPIVGFISDDGDCRVTVQ